MTPAPGTRLGPYEITTKLGEGGMGEVYRATDANGKARSESMIEIRRPERGEIIDYYFTYIDQVGEGDVRAILRAQEAEALDLLGGISEERSRHRYAPGKWSIREVAGHVNDVERLFAFRAFWFARLPDVPLPSFDHEVALAESGADERPLADHLAEFRAVRAATCSLFDGLSATAWERHGAASGNPFSVRGIAYIVAGHLAHHLRLLRKDYL